jgi:hypothetical protein
MTWMLLFCLGIFLLLFLLPGFGFGGPNSLFIFLLIIFGAHLLIIGSLGGHGDHSKHGDINEKQSKNENSHATHQH